jgi:hypothetical protein
MSDSITENIITALLFKKKRRRTKTRNIRIPCHQRRRSRKRRG